MVWPFTRLVLRVLRWFAGQVGVEHGCQVAVGVLPLGAVIGMDAVNLFGRDRACKAGYAMWTDEPILAKGWGGRPAG
ncbi:hypothetical protein Mmc1_2090 [Magnetococcus marinus MC-1]|uniref:Uncharacterized protein n=2 Tax=Magnetococcus TaxID=162171 RepID=A0L9E8_MAGMM|nr:hypothetical protein Mmc1_2090 [Magnetococcus marinus MC-1]